MILGMDIGGTNIRAGLVDADYQVKEFIVESSAAILKGANPTEQLVEFVRDYSAQYSRGRILKAVSIGFPSTLDKQRRKLLSTPNIQGLDNVNIVELLEKVLNIPVFVNRDVNMLILYDIYHHKLDKSGIIIGCYAGTGLGNAVYINGELLTGKNGVAAELGHIPVLDSKRKCTCGNDGCIEIYASGKYLEEIKNIHFPDTPIGKIFSVHMDSKYVHEFIDYLSLPIATEINIFDPDYVVIGGGIVQMENFPRDLLLEKVRFRTRKPYPEANLEFKFSDDRQETGVIGAGIYGLSKLNHDAAMSELA